MAAGSSNPEYRDISDIKDDLIDQAVDLMGEIEGLKSQQADVVKSMHLDASNSLRGVPHAEDDPTWKALKDQIDAKQMVLDQLADQWVTATSGRLIGKGTTEGFKAKAERAYFDSTHVDTEPDFNLLTGTKGGAEDAPEVKGARGKKAEVVAVTRVNINDLQSQVEAFKKDAGSLSHIASALLEAGLAPVDLVSPDPAKQEAAINVAFETSPLLARYLIVELSNPNSTNRVAITATLEDMRTLLSKAYDSSRTSKEFQEKIEQATIEGTLSHKLGGAVKALGKDPLALTAFIGAIIGLGVLYSNAGDDTKGKIKSFLGWGAALAGGTYLTDFLWKKMDDRHRGLFDRLGMSPGDLLAPEIVEKAKAQLAAQGFPETDQQSALDYARVSDMSMSSINEAFQQALADGKREIDPRILQKNGLDSASAKRIDGVSLYKVMEHFYGTMCYNASIKENSNAPTASGLDDRMKLGLAYAKSHCHDKFSNAVYTIGENLHVANAAASAAASGAPSASVGSATGGAERKVGIEGIPDAPLAKLIEDNRLLQGGTVHALVTGDYLIKGYPYSYEFNNGKHVFVQKLDTSKRVEIDESRDAKIQITALLAQAEADVKPKLFRLTSGIGGITEDSLIYNARGFWELTPPVARDAHSGLPNYEKAKTVPLSFEYDARHCFVQFSDPVPGAAPEYTGVADAKKDYEKLAVLPAKVHLDLDHLFLGASFTIQHVNDTGSVTEIKIAFSDGNVGTLTYQNDVLDAISIPTPGAELEAKWLAQAQADVEAFTNRPVVQDQLEKVAHDFAAKQPGIWGSFENALGSLTSYFSHLTDSGTDTRYNDAFVIKMRKFQLSMRTKLRTDLYGGGLNVSDFKAEQAKLGLLYEDAVRGLTDGMLNQPLDQAEKDAMRDLGGVTAVDKLLNTTDLAAEQTQANAQLTAAWKAAGGSHWYSLDSARTAVLDQKIHEQVSLMDAEIALLGTTGKPVISEVEVRKIVDKYLAVATAAVGSYYALDTKTIVDKSIMDRLTGKNKAAWEKPTQMVADYVLYKLKWESYGVIPKPENAMKIMDMWFKKIDNGNSGFITSAGVPPQEPKYATYFLSQIDMRLGGHQDYSPDRLYGEVYSVSDTDFNGKLVGIDADLLGVSDWISAGRPALPLPDALKSADEIYQEKAKVAFTKWFDDQLSIDDWATIDGEWPDVFRNNIIETRLPQVLAGAPDAIHLKQDLKRLAQFASVERSIYVQLRQKDLVVKRGGQALYQNVLNPAWANDWNNPSKTALDYSNDIQANLVTSGIFDTSWYVPRLVGEAMAFAENLLTDL